MNRSAYVLLPVQEQCSCQAEILLISLSYGSSHYIIY